MRRMPIIAGLLAVVASTVSCGDVVREGRSPVYLVIDSLEGAQGNHPGTFGSPLLSDVITNVTSPPPCTAAAPCPTVFNDIGQVRLRSSLKNLGETPGQAFAPTANNDVTITRYHVEFVRADGRNTPGIDVPYAFDGSATGTVQANGTLTMPFEIVRHTAKGETPLVQLIVSPTVISTIANVTFYGRDAVGNEISVTGSLTVNFGNFGDQ